MADLLEPYAAEVVIIQRIIGSRAAAARLGAVLFGHPDMSPTPVDTIVARVESGEIPLTKEDLQRAALADDFTAKHLATKPWLTDPTGKSVPRTKGRKPRPAPVLPARPAVKPQRAKAAEVTTKELPTPAPAVPPQAAPSDADTGNSRKSRDRRPVEKADKPQPELVREEGESDWDELLLQTKEHANKRTPPLSATPKPPSFQSPRIPRAHATNEVREQYLAEKKIGDNRDLSG